jgi:predicted ATPase
MTDAESMVASKSFASRRLRPIHAKNRAAETTKEKWCEAEVHRVAGEIALMLPEPDAPKAEAHFMRAIAVPANSKRNPGNSAPP